ncbi:MAG: hypothetical protein AABY83_11320 [Pseudomonadota bacterium]
MALIQQYAKKSWTDHNVHDPGITLLEAGIYAMTELGLRIQLDTPDLLQSGVLQARPDFVPAHTVLPCAPLTPRELRAVLLDHPLLRDARMKVGAKAEIPFFIDPASDPHSVDPPYTFEPNNQVVVLGGLYEAVVEFAEHALNSNTYTQKVNVTGGTYTLDIALPYWDEEEVKPFQDSPAIDGIVMLVDGGEVWRPQKEPQTYFGEIQVNFGSGGVASTRLWILMRIVEELPQTATETLNDILDAAQLAVQSNESDGLIDQFTRRVHDAYSAVQQIRHYLSSWRNLGEDPVRIAAAREQEIALRATIEVTRSTNLELLLANIFVDIDHMLAPPLRFSSLAERRAAGDGANEIYDGPLLRNGFLGKAALVGEEASVIYVSDTLRLIMRRRDAAVRDLVTPENPGGRDIVAVTDLAISNYINNRPITVDAQNCLHLVETERYRPRLSLDKSRIIFTRNDAEVKVDADRVKKLFLDIREAGESTSLPEDSSPIWPVKQGVALPVDDYIPLQNDLPRVYGVGEARLPDSVGLERKAATLQLQGYLLLFEQFLGDLTAQLVNINRFFSGDPAEQSTYFCRALFDLPDMQKMLVRFAPNADWESFVADANNPYRQAVQLALEAPDRFLDRRNRMFDHLLARQGEDMVAFGQELHRYAQQELLEGVIDPTKLVTRMEARRQAANARLIGAKAVLLRDAPWINGARLQAFGNPVLRDNSILHIVSDSSGFHWTLSIDDDVLLRSIVDFKTSADAVIAAGEAIVLATQGYLYTVVNAGGGRRRYQLQDSTGTVVRIVGEGPQTYSSVGAANNAAQACAQRFTELRRALSLTPFEQRILHLCGIRSRERRRLLTPIDAYFDIYDEVDSDGILEKRWRLWQQEGYHGHVMLSSVYHFVTDADGDAVTKAERSIADVVRYGQDDWNYEIAETVSNTYNFVLRNSSDDKIGRRNPPFPSAAAARAGLEESLTHLYCLYSAEGFHLVEHLLLRPRTKDDVFLSFPAGPDARERDPYSQRLSLVFPSGWMRDFSPSEDSTPKPRFPTAPHRFRDPEFRHYVERMVQLSCPAHLLPNIFWVDRQVPGTPAPTLQDSVDCFEDAYFDWLDALLVSNDTAAEGAARNALITSLNGIANG